MHKPKLLIFEDDSLLGDMYATRFQASGYDVSLYENPSPYPVELVLRENPDIILMNIIMPIMDGFNAVKLLKGSDKTKRIPVVIETNLGQQEEIDKGYALGADDYVICGNTTPTEMVERVNRVLKKYHPKIKLVPNPSPQKEWKRKTAENTVAKPASHAPSFFDLSISQSKQTPQWKFIRFYGYLMYSILIATVIISLLILAYQ